VFTFTPARFSDLARRHRGTAQQGRQGSCFADHVGQLWIDPYNLDGTSALTIATMNDPTDIERARRLPMRSSPSFLAPSISSHCERRLAGAYWKTGGRRRQLTR
jgi:hypothetical protein